MIPRISQSQFDAACRSGRRNGIILTAAALASEVAAVCSPFFGFRSASLVLLVAAIVLAILAYQQLYGDQTGVAELLKDAEAGLSDQERQAFKAIVQSLAADQGFLMSTQVTLARVHAVAEIKSRDEAAVLTAYGLNSR